MNERHDFVVFDSPTLRLQNFLPEVLRELVGKQDKARRITEQLKLHIYASRHPQTINDASLEDIATSSDIKNTVVRVVNHLAPEYPVPEPFIFDVVREGPFARVSTNIDFAQLNAVYHRRLDPRHNTITSAYILSILHQATAELKISASTNSEMAFSPLSTLIARTRLSVALRARLQSERSLRVFQEFVFDDARAIREAVNSGHRNMAELAKLVAEAQKFKSWIKGQFDDAQICARPILRKSVGLDGATNFPARPRGGPSLRRVELFLSAIMTPTIGVMTGAALKRHRLFFSRQTGPRMEAERLLRGPLRVSRSGIAPTRPTAASLH